MDFFLHAFDTLVSQPLYNGLVIFYNIVGNFGLAIILLTILIKLALIPLSKKQIKSQKEMQELQPEIKKLQAKYKDDKEKLSKETMILYKKHHINPAAGCLPLIVQMIVFIGLYRVIKGLSEGGFEVIKDRLYDFVNMPIATNGDFFHILNLAEPNVFLAILTAAAQFLQLKMMQTKNKKTTEITTKKADKKNKEPDFASIMQKQMLFIVPIMTLFIGLKFPSGLALYWLTSTVFMIAQQWYIMHKEKKETSLEGTK
jgi:YidC/Oxa1 family membrane protein insertase